MKGIKIIAALVIISTLIGIQSCKKFLNVVPIDNLSGNVFWKSKQDVESFTWGIYNRYRDATSSLIFFPATGDMRCAPVTPNVGGREYITLLRQNNINEILARSETSWFSNDFFGFKRITKWDTFFAAIQFANILEDKMLNDETITFLTAEEKKAYRAEAVFMRNLCYFMLVRVFGDVPYYTAPYHSEALPRTNMITVLKACVDDLNAVYEDLPWTFEEPSIIAVRAMRGSAGILLMHMNMWIAGFSTEDAAADYYQEVAELGDYIINNNSGAYELIPLEETKKIFKGRSKEGLFEVVQNFNYGENFPNNAAFSDYVLREPYKRLVPTTFLRFDRRFLEELYPSSIADRRKDFWFDEFMFDQTGKMVYLKFINIFAQEGEDLNPDDNQIVFRYADVYLLAAEALAELGRDEEARVRVNVIRERAQAQYITDSGDDLRDAIYWERCRELMGEGHYFYDLVRTKKIIDSDYAFAPIGVEAFNEGAWTWPIDESALRNNPFMDLNNYWR
jgi:hypothetical protein